MRINALCTADPIKALRSCDKVFYYGGAQFSDPRIIRLNALGESGGDVYIPSLLEVDIDETFDLLINSGVHAIVRCAYDLNECGLIDARYGLSPVMLMHKYGVLEEVTVAGGVCLDNDDLDLMAQEGVPLIVLPTASAGYGHGFAPVCAALRRGIRVGIGTLDGKYNKACDLGYEADFLRLTANAEMRGEDSVSDLQVKRMLGFEKK